MSGDVGRQSGQRHASNSKDTTTLQQNRQGTEEAPLQCATMEPAKSEVAKAVSRGVTGRRMREDLNVQPDDDNDFDEIRIKVHEMS